jgi:hypothetical protein
VDLARSDNGIWSVMPTEEERQQQPDFVRELPRYLTALDQLFEKAHDTNEFEFLMTVLGFRGLRDPGWSAYETTLQAVPNLTDVHNRLPSTDAVAARHLKLWIYGHIVEASEPYEVLANLLDIASGGRFRIARFPVGARGHMPSPGRKIETIVEAAAGAGFPEMVDPLRDMWDREFRNAIFHADYALHGVEVRLVSLQRTMPGDEVERLCAQANAFHEGLAYLRRAYLGSYTEPVVIPAQPFAPPPTRSVVVVREGEGAIGLKDAWTCAERARGAIPFRAVVASYEEIAMLDADPDLALLPRRRPTPPPV